MSTIPSVGNWITEITVTEGNGPIKLVGSEAGNAKFSDAIPSGKVWYAIQNGFNREAGIGTFNGVDTIIRDTVHATLIANVYTNVSPTPLQLIGESIVSCTFNTVAFEDLQNHIQSLANPHGTKHDQLSDTNTNGHPDTVIGVSPVIDGNDNQHDLNLKFNAEIINTGQNLADHEADAGNPHLVDHAQLSDTATDGHPDTVIGVNPPIDTVDNQHDLNIKFNSEIDAHLLDTGNPHSVVHAQMPDLSTSGHPDSIISITPPIGLANNQSDFNKLVGTTLGLKESIASGVITGGVITKTSATTISVTAGTGRIVDAYTDRLQPTFEYITWPAQNNVTVLTPKESGLQYFYIDSDGLLFQQDIRFTPQQRRQYLMIGFVSYVAGVVAIANKSAVPYGDASNTLYDYLSFIDAAKRTNGMGMHPTDAGISIWAESGRLLSVGINVEFDIQNPNIRFFDPIGDASTPADITVFYQDGSVHSINNTVLPKLYESAPGVATALTGTQSTIHYISRTFNNNIIVQLGQFLYADGKTARDTLAVDMQEYEDFIGHDSVLISAQAYFSASATDFSDPNLAGIVSLIGSGTNASGGVAVTEFLALTDVTEATYIGHAGESVSVREDEGGVEFVELSEKYVDRETDQDPILGRKTFVNEITVNTSGKQLILQSSNDTLSDIYMQNSLGALRTLLRYEHATERFRISTYDAGGSLLNSFWFEKDGLLTLPNKIPAADSAIRRDFVDNGFLPLTGGTLTGILTIAASSGILALKDTNSVSPASVCYVSLYDSADTLLGRIGKLSNTVGHIYVAADTGNTDVILSPSGSGKARVDDDEIITTLGGQTIAENLGIGNTSPIENWDNYLALQIGRGGAIFSYNSVNDLYLSSNVKFANGRLEYIHNGVAAYVGLGSLGEISLSVVSAGTADGEITPNTTVGIRVTKEGVAQVNNGTGLSDIIHDGGGQVIDGNLQVKALTVANVGTGLDSAISFYDNNSATLRTLFWDDSANAFRIETDSLGNQEIIHGGGGQTIVGDTQFIGRINHAVNSSNLQLKLERTGSAPGTTALWANDSGFHLSENTGAGYELNVDFTNNKTYIGGDEVIHAGGGQTISGIFSIEGGDGLRVNSKNTDSFGTFTTTDPGGYLYMQDSTTTNNRTVGIGVKANKLISVTDEGYNEILHDGGGQSLGGNLAVQGALDVGTDGGGNSSINFYDDTNNTWRTLRWSDAGGIWQVEQSDGSLYEIIHAGGGQTIYGPLTINHSTALMLDIDRNGGTNSVIRFANDSKEVFLGLGDASGELKIGVDVNVLANGNDIIHSGGGQSIGGSGAHALKLNVAANGSGIGLLMDANTRTVADAAVKLIDVTSRTGVDSFFTTVDGDTTITGQLFRKANHTVIDDNWGLVWGVGSSRPYIIGSLANDTITIGANGQERIKIETNGGITVDGDLTVTGSLNVGNQGFFAGGTLSSTGSGTVIGNTGFTYAWTGGMCRITHNFNTTDYNVSFTSKDSSGSQPVTINFDIKATNYIDIRSTYGGLDAPTGFDFIFIKY